MRSLRRWFCCGGQRSRLICVGGHQVVLLHGQPVQPRTGSRLLTGCRARSAWWRWTGRGYGASRQAARGFAVNARAVVAEMDARGIRRAVLVGHSYGGGVALRTSTSTGKSGAYAHHDHGPLWRSFLTEQRALAGELGGLTASLAGVRQPVLLLADPHDTLIPVTRPISWRRSCPMPAFSWCTRPATTFLAAEHARSRPRSSSSWQRWTPALRGRVGRRPAVSATQGRAQINRFGPASIVTGAAYHKVPNGASARSPAVRLHYGS